MISQAIIVIVSGEIKFNRIQQIWIRTEAFMLSGTFHTIRLVLSGILELLIVEVQPNVILYLEDNKLPA